MSDPTHEEDAPLRVVAVLRMGPSNAENFVIPLAASASVASLTVIRPDDRPGRMPNDVRYVSTASSSGSGRVVRTLWATWREIRRDRVDRVVSFNATPYGLIVALVCALRRVPFHVGFVGSDALDLGRRRWAPVADRLLRRAGLTTVPGRLIGDALVARGYDAASIRELPHTIDLDRFVPGDGARDIDVLFVGAFIPRKQVGVLVAGLEIVARDRPSLRCVLLGDGPLDADLRAQVEAAGLVDNVEFAGYQTEPQSYFGRARTIAITSNWEGIPFVLIMGMCCGAIPVTTVVGSIGDLLTDDVDGVLLADDRPATVARAIADLLDDADREERLRHAVLARRGEFGFDHATALWTEWFTQWTP